MPDTKETQPNAAHPPADRGTSVSRVVAVMYDKDGVEKARCETHNIVTAVGDRAYAERAAGVSGAVAAPTGMKLGTGSTATSKTGAGAALTTYLAGSNKPFDGSFPAGATKLAATAPATTFDAWKVTYKRTYAAGEATTASPITEVVVVNDTIATDATSTAANTWHRVLLTGIGSKLSTDSLQVFVEHVQGGQ